MAKMDWRRAQPPQQTADAIGEGFVRRDGTITKTLSKDDLAKRAAQAEAKWMRENGLATDSHGRITKIGRSKF